LQFKKLELFGFKSFAEKTIIEMQPGVTAIVGPNGCGKSNVSDSIRWVLGEQSAKSLRGASMEDVIFNGTANRDAVNFAEVSLTLSNEDKILPIDYDEVTITRRLYRSGESEYLLNNNQVRLKDIHELLMGTGIGTDSYSIIEQGKMDVILSSKAEDRREIFEEAAGITKFKSKKKEALRKLEQTDANLLRVNDIIQEVKRQIGSVERQARRAEQYKVEFDKMKRLELSVAMRDFISFETRRRTKEEELSSLKERESEFVSVLGDVEERCRAEREALLTLDESLKKCDQEEATASADVRRSQDRVLLNRERVGELAERRENLLRQVEGARRRAEEMRREHEKLGLDFEATRLEEEEGLGFLATVEANFAKIEDFIKAATAEEDVVNAGLSELSEKKATLQNDLAKVNAELASLASQVRRLRQEEETVQREDRTAGEGLETAMGAVRADETRFASLDERKLDVERRASALEESIRLLEEETAALAAAEAAFASKLEFLEGLKHRNEGFLGGVKALSEAKDAGDPSVTGMVGLLANLLRVEKGYELAAEAALETYLQAAVFRTDADVLAAADFLRPLGRGRALLVSLEAADGTPANAASHEAEAVLSRITAGEGLDPLLAGLLADVYVADSPARAFELARAYPKAVFVTREGERFEGRVVMGGSLSGQADLSLVGRESRIRETSEALASTREALATKESELSSARTDEKACSEEAKRLSGEALSAQVALSESRVRLGQSEETKERVAGELVKIAAEIEDFLSREKSLVENEKGLNERFYLMAEEDRKLGEAVLVLRASVREKSAEKEGLLVRLAETRSKQAHLTARREKIEKDRGWVLEAAANEETQLAAYEKEASEAEAKREGIERENDLLEAQISDLSVLRDEVLLRAEGIRFERDRAANSLARLEAERDEKAAFLKEARERTHGFELESAQIRFEIDRLRERIFNAYQIDLAVQQQMAETEAAAAEIMGLSASEDLDVEKTKTDIQAIREKLNKMGPVNLVAIEEYDEMKKRFEFLTQQEQDLVKAKEDLKTAIQKINRTTKELFVETFEKTRKHFTEFYRVLFGGGTADLVLLDENDVLESGIEIVARPPGKKLQSISLLSGGEKALTAVALMFALFKVKPSPFCVLDEIDAPLDETNVERFCGLLRDFIGGSQFILITHNKRTMNLADAMYGVTMMQTGVSRIVSVKFGDRQMNGNGAALHVNGKNGAPEAVGV